LSVLCIFSARRPIDSHRYVDINGTGSRLNVLGQSDKKKKKQKGEEDREGGGGEKQREGVRFKKKKQ